MYIRKLDDDFGKIVTAIEMNNSLLLLKKMFVNNVLFVKDNKSLNTISQYGIV